jgi:hypothetical protein
MPDFDTHRPQEPDRPNRPRMFVAASKQHMFAAAGRLRTFVRAPLLRPKNTIRLLGIGLSFLLLMTVLAGGIAFWAVLHPVDHPAGTPGDLLLSTTDELDHQIQLKRPPAYEIAEESDSSAISCEVVDSGYSTYDGCLIVPTEATSAMKLASITEDIITNSDYVRSNYGLVLRVRFIDQSGYDQGLGDDIATIYCFKGKSVAVSALRGELAKAELLGKTDHCYLALYRDGDAAHLKLLD